MPDIFYKRLHRMYLYSCFESIAVLLILGCLLVAIEMLFSKTTAAIVLFSTALCLATALWIYYQHMTKCDASQQPYIVSLPNIGIDAIIRGINAIQIDSRSSFCNISHGKISARVLILYDVDFNAKEMETRRKKINSCINKTYGFQSSVPFYEALTKLRINLVVVEHDPGVLSTWVNKNASCLLRRTESIINTAIVLERQELLFPAINGAFSKIQLDKYSFSADVLPKVLL